MLQKRNDEKGQEINLCDVNQKFEFDEPEIPSEIRLIPISSGLSLEDIGQVFYGTSNRSSYSYNLLNMKCYNNINRARYAFLG